MLKLELIGNIGKDCTVNEYDGKKVINFSVAAQINAGTKREKTIWIDATVWNREGLAAYLTKGTKVYLTGYPDLKVWTSSSDNTAQGVMKLTVDTLELLSGSKKPDNAENNKTYSDATHSNNLTADDVSF